MPEDLIARLAGFAATRPDEVVYIELADDGEEVGRLTYADLAGRAAGVAARLADLGVGRGERALLLAPSSIEFLVGYFGCLAGGVLAVPVGYARRSEQVRTRLLPIAKDCDAAVVISPASATGDERDALALLAPDPSRVIDTACGVATFVERAPHAHAFLQYTSGSTTDPRGVLVSHQCLAANLDVNRRLLDFDGSSMTVSWLPLYHDLGLILSALPSVAFGFPCVLLRPLAFLKRPVSWLEAISRYRATNANSPNFGFDLCVDRTTDGDRAGLDLSSWRTAINGAEPVRVRSQQRFQEAFGPCGFRPDAWCPGYGLAEATVGVAASHYDRAALALSVDGRALERGGVVEVGDDVAAEGDDVRVLLGNGQIDPSYQARIVDPVTDRVVAPRKVGELWLAGPSVAAGYWARPQESASVFGARLPEEPEAGPFLRTGDLAFLHGDELFIVGRCKDTIVLRGRNLYPQDIELAAELAHAAVRPGCCAAFAVDDGISERIVIVAEVDGTPDAGDVTAAVRQGVARQLEVAVDEVVLAAPLALPKTSSGKLQRSACRDQYLSGGFPR